ncbi:MAG TPA: alanine--glyoxylate aminotransferase family protein, partial [Thermoanaerobaculia bacterium]
MSEKANFVVPGPTWVRREILEQMLRPMIGHRSAEFRDLFRSITPRLQQLFQTRQLAFFASSSGTGLMEGALLNPVSRAVLVTTCGAFSARWVTIAHKLGLEADQLSAEWGEPLDPVKLADHLQG